MSEERSVEARIARMEACFGRLEERITAIDENRKEWKVEIERRLEANNENAAKLMEERARDRAELLPAKAYEAGHAQIQTLLETRIREVNTSQSEHERDDVRKHEADAARLKVLEEFRASLPDAAAVLASLRDFRSNIQGRMIVIGGLTGIISGILTALAIHVLTK